MKNVFKNLLFVSILSILAACSGKSGEQSEPASVPASKTSSIIVPSSTSIPSSKPVSSNTPSSASFTNDELSNVEGLVIKFKKTGASIDSIKWEGKTIAKDGFVVGRCANRIAAGKCTISGQQYSLTINNGSNHLHGGNGSGMNSWRGPFATNDWTKVEQTANTITYSFHSKDGDNGYPGNMDMTVKYTLSEHGELLIEYTATSDKDTLCNPTNHLFMTLNGDTSYNNLNLLINADNYTPLVNQLPTGEIAPVSGTKFDYTTEKAFQGSQEYDDNYVLNGEGYRNVASLTGTKLGVKVEVYTDRPGLQLYKAGNGQICLETQMFPDAINQPKFEDPLLKAGARFYSKTAYSFSKITKD